MADQPVRDGRPVVDFDHHSQHYADHAHEIYAGLRARCPVAWTGAHDGYWILSRYEEMSVVSRDDKLYSSHKDVPDGPRKGITLPSTGPIRTGIIETDPPAFTRIRRAVNSWFSPHAVEKLRPEILEYTTWAIDRFIADGRGDLVVDLASPVPALLTLRMLGIPLSHWERYADAMHRGVYVPPGSPERDEVNALYMWVLQQITAAAHERRERPGEDFISYLAQLEFEGEKLPIEDVIGNAMLLLAGGVDTTTALMGHTFVHLHRDRAARAWLMQDPARMTMACEEYLRVYTPVQGLARTVTQPCTLAGQQLDTHDRLWISWQAANLDPAVFEDPETIKLDRFPNHHAAFGLGRHRCLGSTIARFVWNTVVSEVLRRMPDYEVDLPAAVRYTSIGIVNGWATLPARFTPGRALGTSLKL
ncbi:MAG: cytochrome P450 [Gammaproteobacteria bacterium]